MSRTVKRAEVRRAELLDAAALLFAERGYEATSVHAILARVGLSKGAFYHHFDSKEELLLEVSGQLAAVQALRIEALARQPVSALEKLRAFYGWRGHVDGDPSLRAMAAALDDAENTRLRVAVEEAFVRLARPAFATMLREGARELRVAHPLATAELLLHMHLVTLRIAGDRVTVVARRRAHRRAVERILGLADGALDEVRLAAAAG